MQSLSSFDIHAILKFGKILKIQETLLILKFY
jgi:hypothetical protein